MWIRAGRGRDDKKRSGTGTTQAATAKQVGTGGQAHLTGTASLIFVLFPLTSSTHFSPFWMLLFHRVQR